jgi:hypothetical protein
MRCIHWTQRIRRIKAILSTFKRPTHLPILRFFTTAILVGLSDCQLQQNNLSGEDLPQGVGGVHFAEIFETSFQGASGEVFFYSTQQAKIRQMGVTLPECHMASTTSEL